jgi:NADPH:quinone reductase-like Zn-dependent oxidoreductase
MRVFEIREFGIDRLSQAERPDPQPGPGEVLVRLKAASLNHRDLMVVEGTYNPKLKRPMIPLSDGAGIVEEVGPGVTRFQKSDRVAACFMQTWVDGPPRQEYGKSALGGSIDGVLCEQATFSEQGLVRVPDFLTDEEAASLPCAAVTAWHAIFEEAAPVPGETVLLQGTGGVSIFALQFAKAAGLRTIITSGSDEKLARAKELGADEVIPYNRLPNWEEEARRLTGGMGVDRVVEVGGSGTIERSVRAARTHALIAVIGALSGREPAVSPVGILMNSLRLHGIYVGSRAMFERMNRAIEHHRIRPVVDRVFAWTEIREALRYMKSARHFGKICLRFS